MAKVVAIAIRSMKNALRHVLECDLNEPCACDLKKGDFYVYPNEEIHKLYYNREDVPSAIPCSIMIFYLGPEPSVDVLNGSPMNCKEALSFLEDNKQTLKDYFRYHRRAIVLMDFYHTGKLNIKITCKPSSNAVKRICLFIRSLFRIKVKPQKVEPEPYRPIKKLYQQGFSLLTDTVPADYKF